MKIKTDNFEGPLDLLLQLIESEKLDITEVSLLTVTEQYIDFLTKIEDKKPEMLADFLLIAAKLLYIKSRAVLPELEMNEDSDEIDLAQQLKMYKKFVDASKVINRLFTAPTYAYGRMPTITKVEVDFVPAKSLTQQKINSIFIRIKKELEIINKIPQKTMEKVVSIKEKIKYIKELILQRENFNFSELIQDVGNKTEMIVSFLGLLELIKQKDVEASQTNAFEEILVIKTSDNH